MNLSGTGLPQGVLWHLFVSPVTIDLLTDSDSSSWLWSYRNYKLSAGNAETMIILQRATSPNMCSHTCLWFCSEGFLCPSSLQMMSPSCQWISQKSEANLSETCSGAFCVRRVFSKEYVRRTYSQLWGARNHALKAKLLFNGAKIHSFLQSLRFSCCSTFILKCRNAHSSICYLYDKRWKPMLLNIVASLWWDYFPCEKAGY